MTIKQVKAFKLIAGDKLLINFGKGHTAVREIIEIHQIKDTDLYSITCELGVSITCGAQKKQTRVTD